MFRGGQVCGKVQRNTVTVYQRNTLTDGQQEQACTFQRLLKHTMYTEAKEAFKCTHLSRNTQDCIFMYIDNPWRKRETTDR